MFFKRMSDVHVEEFEAALDASGSDHEYAAFTENHRFAIPEGNLWSDVRGKTENIGTALQTPFREIEKADRETLYGIFGKEKSRVLASPPTGTIAPRIVSSSAMQVGRHLGSPV
jgi:type I restriction-modification system DNA methylase subunit